MITRVPWPTGVCLSAPVHIRRELMIELKNIIKRYPGAKRNAVDNISLKIKDGEFFGLLGPNGAGKSTLMGIISTLMLATQGDVFLDGHIFQRESLDQKQYVAVVTQHYSLRNDMTVLQTMELQARLYGMSQKTWKLRSAKLLQFCGLEEKQGSTVRELSGGMKRKLMLARALLTQPKVLLLDEPTVGLDPMSRRQIWDLLRVLNREGVTVLLTTHYMDEAQALCERIAIIHDGHIVKVDTSENLISGLGKYAVDVFDDSYTTSSFFHKKEDALSFAERQQNVITIRNTTLEDVFLDKTGRSLGDTI